MTSHLVSRPRVFRLLHAMDDETCRQVRAAMDAGTAESAEVMESDFALQENVRRASYIEVVSSTIDLVEAHLDRHRDAIADFFGLRLAGREGAALLRYETGGIYLPHVDRADVDVWPVAADRQVTAVLFLNSSCDADSGGDFSGGVLRLLDDDHPPIEIVAKRGMLVGFLAGTVHEVTLVTNGCRDTVVDWFRSGP